MNTELLKQKMREYFDNISPEELIAKFEKMGYSFVDVTEQSEPLLDSGLVKELVSIRNKLYNELPTSEINAFDLITLIKWHINDLDIFCSKLAAASTVPEATTDEDTIGFAEWVVSDNNPSPNKYNSDDDNNGKWCDAFSEGINRHYYTTEQLYQLYRKQSKQ